MGSRIEGYGIVTRTTGRHRIKRRAWTATLLLGLLVPCAVEAQEPSVYGFQVVSVIDHDPAAFTQGLVVDGDYLYESTGGYGHSTLRRLDLASGRILKLIELPDSLFGEGVTVFGERIIQLTWRAGIALVYDRDSLERQRTFQYPGEGWGLTHDGERLIMSDGSDRLHFHDAQTYERLGSLSVTDAGDPVERLNELEYIDGEIYANVWESDRIARISPATGEVRGWIDLTALREQRAGISERMLNGIAYDRRDGRLLVGGKLWDNLYEIRLVPKVSAGTHAAPALP